MNKINKISFGLALTFVMTMGLIACNKTTNSASAPTVDSTNSRIAQADRDTSSADQRARRARYQEAADRMTEMVKAGEITREQMQTRLDGMKKRMGADDSKKISKEDYNLAVSKMRRMVKAGEITREDMETRLGEMRKAMSGSSERGASDADMRARTWLEKTGREIRQAIANGDLTPEEGRAKYQEAERRIKQRLDSEESSDNRVQREASDEDKRARRARYQEAADRMAEMVKAGEITREQMEGRLNRMKKAMSGGKSEN